MQFEKRFAFLHRLLTLALAIDFLARFHIGRSGLQFVTDKLAERMQPAGVQLVIFRPLKRLAHWLQPVQPGASCSTACLRQPSVCKLITCGGQAATHQPQPVQRGVSMRGSSMR